MTHDEVLRIAKWCSIDNGHDEVSKTCYVALPDELLTFANAIIEKCAKECDLETTGRLKQYRKTRTPYSEGLVDGTDKCAAAVRALKVPT